MHRNGNGKSASTLEHEAEQTRAQLAATLDELRHSMSPGQILDQVVDYAKDTGGADFLRNLGNQVRANPLPVTLIGAGMAWLMMSGNRSHARGMHGQHFAGTGSSGMGDRLSGTAHSMRDTAGGMGSSVKDAAGSMSDAARGAGSKISGAAASAAGTATDAASAMRRGMHDARDSVSAMGSRLSGSVSGASETAWSAGRQVADAGYSAGNSMMHAFREQPLLFGALGLAIGAAIGAALPRTQTEDEYLGPSSDALKEQAQEVASEQYDYLKEAAGSTVEAMKSEAEAQGLTGESAADTVSKLADKAGAVADAGMKTAEKETAKAGEALSSAADKTMPSSQKPSSEPSRQPTT